MRDLIELAAEHPRWRYLVVRETLVRTVQEIEDYLNARADQGWELVSISHENGFFGVFRRPVGLRQREVPNA